MKLSDAVSLEELARAAWPAAVGERIAAHAAPRSLVRGSLIVDVADAVWQKQLFHLRGQVLARLKQVLGDGIITDVEFRIAASRRPPQVAQSLNATAPPVESMDEADRIQDPVLRIVYKRARKKASA
ncbi:MAG TPA: DUF721 domain-containing protein [Bryobacteraceae bacterium]|nr:DUF721 domain-containing protein [Bryobacteraceae bacterium]